MFKTLTEDEARIIKPWRAPDLTPPVSQAGLGELVIREGATPAETLSDVGAGTSAELLQSSYDEGYAQGYSEGNVAANASAMERVESLIAALEEAQRSDQQALEQEVIELSRAMARLILNREVEQDPDALLRIVHLALKQLPANNQRPDVHLNPVDAGIIRPLMAKDNSVRIVDDETLVRGACRVQSRASIVESGIDELVAAIALQADEDH